MANKKSFFEVSEDASSFLNQCLKEMGYDLEYIDDYDHDDDYTEFPNEVPVPVEDQTFYTEPIEVVDTNENASMDSDDGSMDFGTDMIDPVEEDFPMSVNMSMGDINGIDDDEIEETMTSGAFSGTITGPVKPPKRRNY